MSDGKRQTEQNPASGVGQQDYFNSAMETVNQQLRKGEAPQALTLINETIEQAKKWDDQMNQARLLGLKGIALKQIGNPKQAVDAFIKSEKIARGIEHLPILIDALTQIGKIRVERGEADQAVPILEEAYRKAFESQDHRREMYLSGLQGDMYMVLEQHGKAMEFYALGLEKAQQLQQLEAQCSYQIAIGKIFLLKEDFGPAEEHFKNALDLGTRLSHAGYEFQAFENLLNLSILGEDIQAVRQHGREAVRLAKEIGDLAGEASTISDLVDYLLQEEDYRLALDYLERGLSLAEQAHDQSWQLKMIADQGIAHYYLGELESGEEKFNQALEKAIQLQMVNEEAVLKSQLSALKADQGDLEASLKLGESALEAARESGQRRIEADQYVLNALSLVDLKRLDQAASSLEKGVDIYQELDLPELAEQARAAVEIYDK
jgi:tetratricopeptide (TPR) repeat protein